MLVDGDEPTPGTDALNARPPVLGHDVPPEVRLLLGSGCKVDVAALGCKGNVPTPIPDKPRLPQAGASGDDGDIATLHGLSLVQNREVRRPKRRDAPGIGLQVVDQPDLPDSERTGRRGRIHSPGQVYALRLAVRYRPRDPEGDARQLRRMGLEEHIEHLCQG